MVLSFPGYSNDVADTCWIVPFELVPKLSASGFSETFNLEKRVHLNLVTHDPIVIHFFHNSYSILVVAFSSFWEVALFRLFLVVHQPCNAETDTCLELHNPFHFSRIGTRADANIHKTCKCRFPSTHICTVVEEWTQGYFCLGYFSSSTHTSTSWCGWLRRCGGSVFWFLRAILGFVTETAMVSLRTLAFFFPLVTDTFSSFNTKDSLTILDHCSWFDSPMPGVKVSWSKFLIYTSLHHRLQFLIVKNRCLLMNLQVEQFQYNSGLRRLTYSKFVQTFQDTIGWNLSNR